MIRTLRIAYNKKRTDRRAIKHPKITFITFIYHVHILNLVLIIASLP